jgi:hypothetical protein
VTIPGAGQIGAHALAVESTGGIVYGGVVPWGTGDDQALVVGRVTTDGSADPGFAYTGLLTNHQPSCGVEVGTALALLPAGGIAVTGFADSASVIGNHFMFAAEFTDEGGRKPYLWGRGLRPDPR